MHAQICEKIELVRRYCNWCFGRKHFKQADKEKEAAQQLLKELVDLFNSDFERLRKIDDESIDFQKPLKNKRICLDALDKCRACSKEEPLIAKTMNKIRIEPAEEEE